MHLSARPAEPDDLPAVLGLYRTAVAEQSAIKPVWALADALPEPSDTALQEIMQDGDSLLVVGELDGVPLGFAWARSEALLPQAGERVAVVRLIFTAHEARGVGVGDAMISLVLDHYRSRGHRRFDARVSPGHRHAKNFFEANGFSARLIIMHHVDDE